MSTCTSFTSGGKAPIPFPLLLIHGYPDWFYRFARIIPMVTDPASYGGKEEDAFDVIVPDLPAYGFSGKPQKSGTLFDAVLAIHLTDVPFGHIFQKRGDLSPAEAKYLEHVEQWMQKDGRMQ